MDNQNWKNSKTTEKISGTLQEIDLLEYFGLSEDKKTQKILWDCNSVTSIFLENNSNILLKDIHFSDFPKLYINNTILQKSKFLRATGLHKLLTIDKFIYIDPKFILVFIDGKYSKNWNCIDSTLILNELPKRSVEIYLQSNFDYNLQDETQFQENTNDADQYYYSNETNKILDIGPEIGFTFNNLRKNQFAEHHLIVKDKFTLENLGIQYFIKRDLISTRHLLQFISGKIKTRNVIFSNNVVQNQSETYEDIIIRKKLCEQDTPWSKDFSLWAGVDDIYSTSNSSSTMFFDQFGRLIDPVSIDWFNKRLAPFGDYEYVEIQHPENKVYTGEIYFPAVNHDPEHHEERDPLNNYRYRYLYETNYKLVTLSNGIPFEYDTYFQKIFETLHLEETVYVKELSEINIIETTDDNGNLSITEDYGDYTFIPHTKKTENLYLDDLLLNTIYQNNDSNGDDANILTKIISVQIQSDTSFIRREIITTGVDQLKIEVPKTTSMMVFVDGKKQVEGSYKIYNDTINNKHYVSINEIYADEQKHIVNIFYYNERNLKNENSYILTRLGQTNTNLGCFAKKLNFLLLPYYVGQYEIVYKYKKYLPIIGYIGSSYGLNNISYMDPEYGIDTSNLNDDYVDIDYSDLINDYIIKQWGAIAPHTNPCSSATRLVNLVTNNCVGNNDSLLSNSVLVLFSFNGSYIDTFNKFNYNISSDVVAESSDISARYFNMLDCINVCFYTYDSNNHTTLLNELPLTLLLLHPYFSHLILELYCFEYNNGGYLDYTGTNNVSIDVTNFYSGDQSFAVNNLRKNIYMEKYNKICSFHIFDYPNFSKHHSIPHTDIVFSSAVFHNLSYVRNNVVIKTYDGIGVVNNYDTLDNNFFYGSVFVRNFVNDSFQRTYKVKLIYDPNWYRPELVVTVTIAGYDDENDIIPNENEEYFDTPVWTVDEYGIQCVLPYETIESENVKVYITSEKYFTDLLVTDTDGKVTIAADNKQYTVTGPEDGTYTLTPISGQALTTDTTGKVIIIANSAEYTVTGPNADGTYTLTPSLLLKEECLVSNMSGGSIHSYGKQTIVRFDIVNKENEDGDIFASPEDINQLKTEIERKYMYIKIIDTDEDYFDIETYSDDYRASVFWLENDFNRYSTMMFDNAGYLVSPDSIDWAYTTFNYPMEEKKLYTLPLNSTYPAVIGEVYDNSLEREQIMNLCLNDVISINGELHRIGGDIIEGKTEENVEIPEEGWEGTGNKYIPPDYYNDLFVPDTGLRNIDIVPIEITLIDTEMWERLCNVDYVYWKRNVEYEDIMKIDCDTDDYIKNNVFVFINGMKVNPEDLEQEENRHLYRIYNFSKYKTPRYKFKKNSRVNEFEQKLYVDDNLRYTFDETQKIVTMNDDSMVARAEYSNVSDITDDTRVVILEDIEYSREIVVYNYNPDDIEYEVFENLSEYVFEGYYDYDLRKYALVFVNGLKQNDFVIEDEKIILDLEPNDEVEIYVFKKFDYNWIDEVKYDQYRDNRYFNVHNLRTVRMI